MKDRVEHHLCPRFERTFLLLGKRWNGLIIRVLLDGKGRFSEIEQVLSGISGRMLSERLRELEHEGIVQREVFSEIPVRIEYSLTEKGRALASALDPIQNWAEKWLE
jgi:DNA-binding HxlR family transcriptional regulator